MISTFFLRIIGFWFFIGILSLIYTSNVGNLYREYRELSEYRRLNPDFLPNANTIRLSDAGHDTTYADILWINLIQYIWDNAGNGTFRNYLNPLITGITDLSPHFSSPYNLALILSPILSKEKPSYIEERKLSESALEIGKKWIQMTCDQNKIKLILKEEASKKLWDNESLKDPCEDGILPYNIAYTASELSHTDDAESYYKIASMNHDSPLASRFLGTLARAKEGDHLSSAEKFLLISIEWYDEDPYICKTLALEILTSMKRDAPLKEIISHLREKEKKLIPSKDTKNPLATSGTSCNESLVRAMKQLYLGYIAEVGLKKPDITEASDLVQAWLLDTIPSTLEQDGWDVTRTDSLWKYRPHIEKVLYTK